MMSVKTIRIDDMEEGEVLADETVTLGLDGKSVQLDLSTKNAAKLRNWLAPWIAAGRSAGGATYRAPKKQVAGDREQKMAIREWANAQGLRVSHKGRIPQQVMDAFNEAHTHPMKDAEQPAFSAV